MSGVHRMPMYWVVATLIACGAPAPEDAGPSMDASPDAARVDASDSLDARAPGLDASTPDASRADGGSTDAGGSGRIDAGEPCVPTSERCNGDDDDCDGTVDEDPVDCVRPGAVTECQAGSCIVATCNALLGDCDDDPANGCEARLDTTASCGACGVACALANAASACVSGACAIATCTPGWADCDADASSGCETSLSTITSCGACGVICAPPHGSPACPAGVCEVGVCDGRWGNCDGVASNGCESPLDTVDNCGGCGAQCVLANATPSCDGASCIVDSCLPGFADCDLDPANGCEANLTSDATCGDCATRCGPIPGGSTWCSGGACELSCSPDFADCDGDRANGCEQSLRAPAHCGACGRTCGAGLECRSGSCTPSDWRRLSAGGNYNCALRSNGEVWCWGYGFSGQLGDGRVTDDYRLSHDLTPTPVRALVTNAVALGGSGSGTMCAILRDRRISCWGVLHVTSSFDTPISTPMIIPGISDVTSLTAQGGVTVTHSTGRVSRWDYRGVQLQWGVYDAASVNGFIVRRSGYVLSGNWYGVDPVDTRLGTYRTVRIVKDVVDGASGISMCGIHSDGRLSCWGSHQPTIPPPSGVVGRPYLRPDVTNVVQVAVGGTHICVLHADRTVSCWGQNDWGQLGNGTLTDSDTAVPVPGLANVVEISAGGTHTCARRSDDAILCWGSNGHGQIGQPATRRCRPGVDPDPCPVVATPTIVHGLP